MEWNSQFVQIDILESCDAQTVRNTIEKLERSLRKSITFDQRKENGEHKELSEHFAMTVYFCHLHSPWEKDTCEDTKCL
jgi:IS30 family transposase